MDKEEFRRYLETAVSRNTPSKCPPIEEIMKCREGQAPPEVKRHVDACAECGEVLRDMSSFFDAPAADEQAAAISTAAEYERFQNRLERSSRAGSMPKRVERRAPPIPVQWRAIAAVLTLACGLSLLVNVVLWNSRQQDRTAFNQRVGELEQRLRAQLVASAQPGIDERIIDLFAAGASGRGRGDAAEPVSFTAGAPVTLLLNGLGNSGRASIEIRANQVVVWTGGPVQVDRGTAVVRIPRGFLKPGSYIVQVNADGNTEQYPFKVS